MQEEEYKLKASLGYKMRPCMYMYIYASNA